MTITRVSRYLLLVTQELIFVLTYCRFINSRYWCYGKLLEAIILKRLVKKETVDRLLAHTNNFTANNWDKECAEDTHRVLHPKGVIDEHFKILS